MKPVSKSDIAYKDATKAVVLDLPFRSSKNIRTSITSAKTSFSSLFAPSYLSSSTPLIHLFESLMKILMTSGLRLILKISFIEAIVSSQV